MYLLIDLYTHKSRVITEAEQQEWCEGVEPTKGDKLVWDFEEYLVVQL